MTADRFVEDIYPLTPMQRGMLFHSLHAPQSTGMYVQQIEIRFRGALDSDRLKAAWEAVIARHAGLRTLFVWDEKKAPVQAVCRRFALPWREESWAHSVNAEERLGNFLREDRARGFDLSSGPPFRCALFHTAQGAILIWTFHHVAIDGWSMSILLKEVLAHYAAACEGRVLSLAAPPPFRDYVVWLRSRAQDAGLEFWKAELLGFPGNLPLPIERDTHDLEEYAEREIALSSEATSLLEQMARRERVTLNACVQTAWALLLARYCGADDLVFGATHAGRPPDLPGSDAMVGMFLNTVPVRVSLRQEDTIRDVLRRIFTGQLSREEHAWVSLAAIERTAERRGTDPLFDSLVVFENYPIPAVSMPAGLALESVRGYDRTNYPLTLLAMPGAQLTLRLAWQTNRFGHASIECLLRQLGALLEALPSSLDMAARRGPLMDEVQRKELLAWNATQWEFGSPRTLPELLEAQAIATPESTAVSFEGQSLTYRELHERANMLAGHLAGLGCGPETVVAIEIERSLELIVGLLGIVKCGAAWLPIDPSEPLSRRQVVARDAGAIAVLVRSPGGVHACERVVALDSVPVSGDACELRKPLPENLAYVICTSGSSGKPKGVMNTHEGLVNRLLWMQERFQLVADDIVLQKTPPTFDVSVWEFFWPLMVGARLAVAAPETHKDPDALARTIKSEGVTTLHFVPSMLRAFVEYAEGNFRSLRRVICSGEGLPPDLVRQFHARFEAELHNLYGPTEAAIDVTHHACTRGEEITPIGMPIANTQAWVLDARLAPQPIGVPGELYLGGVQLARGYIGNPAVTADRFVPDPFRPGTGARLYRTGDRARLLPNGEIAYLGRTDFQVKVRGFRVEPGEIEAHLENHPSVGHAAVICFAGPEGNRLAAYVVARNGVKPEPSALRAHLRHSLPEHMVPSAFMVLDQMPLTTSGKVDRKALASTHDPRAVREEPSAEQGSSQSRSAIEREVRAIWEETLQTSGIGSRENFFDVGGNSLLLVPVHRKLVARFGTTLSVPDLFRFPTIESLSMVLCDPADRVPQGAGQKRSANGLDAQRALRRQVRGV